MAPEAGQKMQVASASWRGLIDSRFPPGTTSLSQSEVEELFREYETRHISELTLARQEGYAKGLDDGNRIAKSQSDDRIRVAEEAVEVLKKKDVFTDLWNQQHFYQILWQFIYDAARDRRNLEERRSGIASLWFIDINRMKQVNHDLGHLVANHMILTFRDLLKQRIRQQDTDLGRLLTEEVLDQEEDGTLTAEEMSADSGRLGGDEFGVLERKVLRPNDSFMGASRLMAEYRGSDWRSKDPLLVPYHPSVSIGVCPLRLASVHPHKDWNHAETESWAKYVADTVMPKWSWWADKRAMYECKDNKLATPVMYVLEFDSSKGDLVSVESEGGSLQTAVRLG